MAEYEIIKELSGTTALALNDNKVYVLKKIVLEDTDLYKTIMKIDNPNLVHIVGFTTAGNDFYAVEEYINGETLDEYVKKKGVLSEEEMNDITCDICSGLWPLHEKGIVHRDLTPRNIMITAESKAVIIDFGISRFRKADKTADTQILGTQGFAAPEQFGFSQTDSRADIYSIGVLMNYMLMQSLPNEKPAGGKPGKIIAKCISPDVNDRYQSVEELRSVIKKKINLFPIPGFRKKKWWHIAVAVFYYSAAVFFAVIAFLSGIEKSPVTAVLNSIGFIYMFLVPVVAVFYFNKWLNKWFFTRNNRVWERVIIIILTIFVLTIIGFLLFFLV